VDLAAEERHVGRDIEAAARREHLHHRRSGRYAALPGLRLRELDDDAAPNGRGCREQGECAALEQTLIEPVARRAGALTEDENGEAPPREERRRGERADGPAEHHDVEVLAGHGPPSCAPPRMRTAGRPPARASTVTRPSAKRRSARTSSRCSS